MPFTRSELAKLRKADAEIEEKAEYNRLAKARWKAKLIAAHGIEGFRAKKYHYNRNWRAKSKAKRLARS